MTNIVKTLAFRNAEQRENQQLEQDIDIPLMPEEPTLLNDEIHQPSSDTEEFCEVMIHQQPPDISGCRETAL